MGDTQPRDVRAAHCVRLGGTGHSTGREGCCRRRPGKAVPRRGHCEHRLEWSGRMRCAARGRRGKGECSGGGCSQCKGPVVEEQQGGCAWGREQGGEKVGEVGAVCRACWLQLGLWVYSTNDRSRWRDLSTEVTCSDFYIKMFPVQRGDRALLEAPG